jgi:hypothetical protein
MPVSSNNSYQNVLVNTAFRALTIEVGMSCSHTMLSKNALATIIVEYGWPTGMKYANFDKRSMTVSTTDFLLMRGNPPRSP